MSPLQQEKVIAGLRTENAYPHKISKIVVEETHISWIFLTGLYAYKIKKSIKFGKILDFSSLEFRKISCQKEVELNKILCGNMYKGVVKVVGKNGDNIIRITNLEHKGKPLEYAVKMREIPQQYRMDNLLWIGKVNLRTIERLVGILLKFHLRTRTSAEIEKYGKPKFIKEKIKENFGTIAKFANIDLKLEKILLSFVQNNNNLFRDIHGDLHLRNVFILQNRFYLYDRIEFNDPLRYADIAEDVAHLSMDLDHHYRTDFRKYFISQYIRKSNDHSLEKVVYFWMCYKACVRAKVSLFHAKNEKVVEKKSSYNNEAKDLFILANSYIEFL
jgi:aminoglycoside phosphotransferase family enzyme